MKKRRFFVKNALRTFFAILISFGVVSSYADTKPADNSKPGTETKQSVDTGQTTSLVPKSKMTTAHKEALAACKKEGLVGLKLHECVKSHTTQGTASTDIIKKEATPSPGSK
jgi:hypothetical protein